MPGSSYPSRLLSTCPKIFEGRWKRISPVSFMYLNWRWRKCVSRSLAMWSTFQAHLRPNQSRELRPKGGLESVTRALVMEFAREGIRFNTIAPGVVNTPMNPVEAHEFL